MTWLTDLLKHLHLSRSVVVALFVASAFQYFGARYFADYVEPVPRGWGSAVFLTMITTATLLFFWAAAAVWKVVTQKIESVLQRLAAMSLSKSEVELLLAMARDPNNPLNVDNIDYESLPISKLELLNILRALGHKGLVRKNQFASCLYSTTASGEKRALDLIRERQ